MSPSSCLHHPLLTLIRFLRHASQATLTAVRLERGSGAAAGGGVESQFKVLLLLLLSPAGFTALNVLLRSGSILQLVLLCSKVSSSCQTIHLC